MNETGRRVVFKAILFGIRRAENITRFCSVYDGAIANATRYEISIVRGNVAAITKESRSCPT